MIGNDPYYGGLGGQFVIGTKSRTTGTLVLRHEMGHNFIDVGEEYDGGQVYRGVNSASSLNNVGWGHWLSDPSGVAKEEQSTPLLEEYPWYDLSQGVKEFTFSSTGGYKRWYVTRYVHTHSGAESRCGCFERSTVCVCVCACVLGSSARSAISVPFQRDSAQCPQPWLTTVACA